MLIDNNAISHHAIKHYYFPQQHEGGLISKPICLFASWGWGLHYDRQAESEEANWRKSEQAFSFANSVLRFSELCHCPSYLKRPSYQS